MGTYTTQVDVETNLLQRVLTTASNFMKSPAEVETQTKVNLEDVQVKEETKDKFCDLCKFFSKGYDDIGKTLLVKMDINTKNSLPFASRPYTLH